MTIVRPIVLVSSAAAAAAAGFAVFRPDQPHTPAPAITALNGALRSTRTAIAMSTIVLDYKMSLYGLDKEKDREEFMKQLSICHSRTAHRILKVCRLNSGVYIKAGQHIASLRPAIPHEITSVLASLNDHAPETAINQIIEVIEESFKTGFTEMFSEFDEKPVGCASLAQVHRGRLRENGQEVAVKVQHPHLKRTFPSDMFTLRCALQCAEWAFNGVELMWIVPVFQENLSKELDFTQEMSNARRCSDNFSSEASALHVPHVLDQHTCSRVMTMEFIHGCAVDNKTALLEMGFDPIKIADMMAQTFSEMIFVHGFVHCDPHPGNVLVRRNVSGGPQLVLLDHGLYREISEHIRFNYSSLWVAAILQNETEVVRAANALGLGEYSKFLPIMLVGRSTRDHNSKLGQDFTHAQRRKMMKEMGVSQASAFQDVSAFMEKLPRDLLFCFRAQNLVRGVHEMLGGKREKRFVTFAKAALKGLDHKNAHGQSDEFSINRGNANSSTGSSHNILEHSKRVAAARSKNVIHRWGNSLRGMWRIFSFEVRLFLLESLIGLRNTKVVAGAIQMGMGLLRRNEMEQEEIREGTGMFNQGAESNAHQQHQ
eukprot:c25887_g1_i1.p1 GENE.c25887_g1_i1~~c25887_g1_i1.p1  ORF type:complete len:598 (-),score=133.47 c25887_g1_i1:201-1994(-)